MDSADSRFPPTKDWAFRLGFLTWKIRPYLGVPNLLAKKTCRISAKSGPAEELRSLNAQALGQP